MPQLYTVDKKAIEETCRKLKVLSCLSMSNYSLAFLLDYTAQLITVDKDKPSFKNVPYEMSGHHRLMKQDCKLNHDDAKKIAIKLDSEIVDIPRISPEELSYQENIVFNINRRLISEILFDIYGLGSSQKKDNIDTIIPVIAKYIRAGMKSVSDGDFQSAHIISTVLASTTVFHLIEFKNKNISLKAKDYSAYKILIKYFASGEYQHFKPIEKLLEKSNIVTPLISIRKDCIRKLSRITENREVDTSHPLYRLVKLFKKPTKISYFKKRVTRANMTESSTPSQREIPYTMEERINENYFKECHQYIKMRNLITTHDKLLLMLNDLITNNGCELEIQGRERDLQRCQENIIAIVTLNKCTNLFITHLKTYFDNTHSARNILKNILAKTNSTTHKQDEKAKLMSNHASPRSTTHAMVYDSSFSSITAVSLTVTKGAGDAIKSTHDIETEYELIQKRTIDIYEKIKKPQQAPKMSASFSQRKEEHRKSFYHYLRAALSYDDASKLFRKIRHQEQNADDAKRTNIGAPKSSMFHSKL